VTINERGDEPILQMTCRLEERLYCDGVHVMAIGSEEVVSDILVAAGI
jgi:hypothetical protein